VIVTLAQAGGIIVAHALSPNHFIKHHAVFRKCALFLYIGFSSTLWTSLPAVCRFPDGPLQNPSLIHLWLAVGCVDGCQGNNLVWRLSQLFPEKLSWQAVLLFDVQSLCSQNYFLTINCQQQSTLVMLAKYCGPFAPCKNFAVF